MMRVSTNNRLNLRFHKILRIRFKNQAGFKPKSTSSYISSHMEHIEIHFIDILGHLSDCFVQSKLE